MHPIDQVQLAFTPESLRTLNLVLGLIMFGVALDLKVQDFVDLAKRPIAPAVGLFAQFLILPPVALLLAKAIAPTPSVGLGMLLVGCCPGGNISNYLAWLARGRVATSVGMTAVSTLVCMVLTPLNFAFWGSQDPEMAALFQQVSLDPLSMAQVVAVLLGLPVVLGMTLAARAPSIAAKLRKPFKVLSIAFFAVFVGIAFSKNFDHFLDHIATVFVPVLVLNAAAFAVGYGLAAVTRLDSADRRAVSIEVGIQNSGLGLILVFNFFGGMGGMAVTAAWWGIWHILAGMTLASLWARRPGGVESPQPA